MPNRGEEALALSAYVLAYPPGPRGEVQTAAGRDKYHLHNVIRWNTFSKRKIVNKILTVDSEWNTQIEIIIESIGQCVFVDHGHL